MYRNVYCISIVAIVSMLLAFAREHREFDESQCAHSASSYHLTKPILTSQSTNITYTCMCILIWRVLPSIYRYSKTEYSWSLPLTSPAISLIAWRLFSWPLSTETGPFSQSLSPPLPPPAEDRWEYTVTSFITTPFKTPQECGMGAWEGLFSFLLWLSCLL